MKFKEKFKIVNGEIFKVSPKVQMNLLLTFESYDNQVIHKDMYMPEEKIINYKVGYLKLRFQGTLRITINRDKNKPVVMQVDEPNQAYGVVEKNDLTFKIDKPVTVKYFFIRPNKEFHKNKSGSAELEIKGYYNDVIIFDIKKYLKKDLNDWVQYYS
jgi:hypothetical protein